MTEAQVKELYAGEALAEEKHVIIGEAMTIYHMPIYKKLKELLETGVLGKVNLITMNFGSFDEHICYEMSLPCNFYDETDCHRNL